MITFHDWRFKMKYGFLEDINGDKCAKVLMGVVVITICIIMCIVAFFYALFSEIKSPSIIEFIIISLGSFGSTLIGITAFQKKK